MAILFRAWEDRKGREGGGAGTPMMRGTPCKNELCQRAPPSPPAQLPPGGQLVL